jgi:hypothetical protein
MDYLLAVHYSEKSVFTKKYKKMAVFAFFKVWSIFISTGLLCFQVLARVIAAVVKFDTEQTSRVLQKEEQKQTLVGY